MSNIWGCSANGNTSGLQPEIESSILSISTNYEQNNPSSVKCTRVTFPNRLVTYPCRWVIISGRGSEDCFVHHLGVGKSGLIRLLWEQESEGSNPSTETKQVRYSVMATLQILILSF